MGDKITSAPTPRLGFSLNKITVFPEDNFCDVIGATNFILHLILSHAEKESCVLFGHLKISASTFRYWYQRQHWHSNTKIGFHPL